MLTSIAGVEFNSKGYMVNFDAWNKEVASEIAKQHKLELTDCHWTVINFLRDYYREYGIAPEPREIVNRIGKAINPNMKCDRKHLESLFLDEGCKLACKIAGLPDCHCRGV